MQICKHEMYLFGRFRYPAITELFLIIFWLHFLFFPFLPFMMVEIDYLNFSKNKGAHAFEIAISLQNNDNIFEFAFQFVCAQLPPVITIFINVASNKLYCHVGSV